MSMAILLIRSKRAKRRTLLESAMSWRGLALIFCALALAPSYLAEIAAVQKTDVLALSLGVNTHYEIIRRLGLGAFGSAFYSPGVTTFGSAHNLYDFTAGADIRLAPRLTALGGYRWLKFTTVGEPDVRVQNEVFAGLRWHME